MVHPFIHIFFDIIDKSKQDKFVTTTVFFARFEGFGPSGKEYFNLFFTGVWSNFTWAPTDYEETHTSSECPVWLQYLPPVCNNNNVKNEK